MDSLYDRIANAPRLLQALFGLGVGILIYRSRRNKARRDAVERRLNSIPAGLDFRACDLMECSLDVGHRVGALIDTNVLLLDADSDVREEVVQKSLDLLWHHYIMLRLRIVSVDTGAKLIPRYLVEMEPSPPRCRLEVRDEVDWKEVFDSELLRPLDPEVGPLWRVCMLNLGKSDDKHRYAFVFTFHHAVLDGSAIMQILTEFARNIDELVCGREPPAPDHIEDRSHLMTPNISTLLKDDPRVAFSLSDYTMPFRFDSIFGIVRTGLAEELDEKLGPIGPYETKTSIEQFSLSADECKALKSKCKQAACTVHGACTAAAALALRELARTSGVDDKFLEIISSTLNVSMRRFINFDSKGRLGNFISLIGCPIYTQKPGGQDLKKFWDLAHEMSEVVHRKLKNGDMFNFSKIFSLLSFVASDEMNRTKWKSGGTRYSSFNISNRGLFKTDNDSSSGSDERAVRVSGVYWATSEHSHAAGRFVHNIVSLDSEMYWSVTYYPNVARRECARKYADLVKSILLENISD